MNARNFTLQPFPPAGPRPRLKLTGDLSRRGNTLTIRYALRGQLTDLAIPGPAATAARRTGLWEETCCEFFLAVQDSPRYWEFNLSPAGHWNVYRFASYRQGMVTETAFTSMPFRVQNQPGSLRLALELDLQKIVRADQILTVAVAAVLKLAGGGVTYWALNHGGPQPDFHRRDGFILEL
jgi:hypothetical protein